MKNSGSWKETKYIFHNGVLRASRNRREVNLASRVIIDQVACYYQRYAPDYAKGVLLDLGCGKAPFYKLMKPHVISYDCMDWENSLHPNPHLDATCDLTQPLRLEDDSYDTVLLSDVLEHIPVPSALLAEIFRILKPGGILLMNVPFYYWIHEHPFDYYRYTRYALDRLLREAGFEIRVLKEIGGAPEIFIDFVSKIMVRVPYVGDLSVLALQGTYKLLGKMGLVSPLSARSSKNFPLGYFVVAQKNNDK